MRNVAPVVAASRPLATSDDYGFWLDATGVAHLFGGEVCLLDDLIGRLEKAGMTARAGLADTLGAAHALARFATGPRHLRPGHDASYALAPQGETRAALATLPVEALRLEPDATLLLRRLGLKRIGQLYGLPRSALERRFRDEAGRTARRLAGPLSAAVLLRLDQALGVAAEPLQPLSEPPQFLARLTFEEPLISTEGITTTLVQLAHDLCRQLDTAGCGLRRAVLTLYRVDTTSIDLSFGASVPTKSPEHIVTLVSGRLDGIDAGFGIDVMTLAAIEVERVGTLQPHLAGDTEDPRDFAELVDRLVTRLGRERLYSLVPFASHIPERAQRRTTCLVDSVATPSRSAEALSAAIWHAAPSRPSFLLDPPEPITVVAEVPEGPPLVFTWRRVTRRVARAEGPERIAPEWWRTLPLVPTEDGVDVEADDVAEATVHLPTARVPRTRDYYRIEEESGGQYWVFREGLYSDDVEIPPRWFVHGVYG